MSAGPLAVLWHDLECGGYDADLPLWRELAAGRRSAVLEIGAGTGRVTLDLARRGHEVVALDADPTLLETLRERGAGLPVETARADARDFELARRFGLIIVPMQTLQLLGGPDGRARFLRCARAHLEPGGLLAAALANALQAFDEEHDQPPLPDMREIDGIVYASRPVAIRDEGERAAIHRVRETVDGSGAHTAEDDVVRLDRVDAETVAAEAAAHGLAALPPRRIPETDEHIGSTVVMFRG